MIIMIIRVNYNDNKGNNDSNGINDYGNNDCNVSIIIIMITIIAMLV